MDPEMYDFKKEWEERPQPETIGKPDAYEKNQAKILETISGSVEKEIKPIGQRKRDALKTSVISFLVLIALVALMIYMNTGGSQSDMPIGCILFLTSFASGVIFILSFISWIVFAIKEKIDEKNKQL